MEEEASDMDDDDELEEEPSARDSPKTEWKLAQSEHQLKSEGLDQLMTLTGLRDIKKKAMGMVKEVLLQEGRPAF